MAQSQSPYRRELRQADVLAILLSAALMLAFTYFIWIMSHSNLIEERFWRHEGIIDKTAYFPYPYRVLVPFTMEGVIRLWSLVMPYRTAFLAAYTVYDFAALYLILVSLYYFLREWFSRNQALVGTLFVASVMAITLRDHGYQPWSFLEVSLFTGGLLFMRHRHYRRLMLIVLLASLNRETGVFIPLAFVLTQIDIIGIIKREKPIPRETVMWAAIYFAIWLAIFGGLRLIRGQPMCPTRWR